jgi:hypothetical protein
VANTAAVADSEGVADTTSEADDDAGLDDEEVDAQLETINASAPHALTRTTMPDRIKQPFSWHRPHDQRYRDHRHEGGSA